MKVLFTCFLIVSFQGRCGGSLLLIKVVVVLGHSIDNFQEFFQFQQLKTFRKLPFLVMRGIWIAHNASLFNGSGSPAFKTSHQILALLPFYLVSSSVKEPSLLRPVNIIHNVPWGFFDGTCQGFKSQCSIGFQLHLSNSNFISGL